MFGFSFIRFSVNRNFDLSSPVLVSESVFLTKFKYSFR